MRILLFLTTVFVMTATSLAWSVPLATQQKPQSQKEQFVNWNSETAYKRFDNLKEGWDASLIAAMETRTGGYSDRADKALMQMMAKRWVTMANDFWTDDGVFKQETYDKTILRIPLVPGEAERAWRDAVSLRGSGGVYVVKLIPMLPLGWLLNQGALFARGEWQEAAFSKLLARVTSLPYEAVSEWAKRRGLDPFIAAISLARVDAVFPNEHFQPGLLAAQP